MYSGQLTISCSSYDAKYEVAMRLMTFLEPQGKERLATRGKQRRALPGMITKNEVQPAAVLPSGKVPLSSLRASRVGMTA